MTKDYLGRENFEPEFTIVSEDDAFKVSLQHEHPGADPALVATLWPALRQTGGPAREAAVAFLDRAPVVSSREEHLASLTDAERLVEHFGLTVDDHRVARNTTSKSATARQFGRDAGHLTADRDRRTAAHADAKAEVAAREAAGAIRDRPRPAAAREGGRHPIMVDGVIRMPRSY